MLLLEKFILAAPAPKIQSSEKKNIGPIENGHVPEKNGHLSNGQV